MSTVPTCGSERTGPEDLRWALRVSCPRCKKPADTNCVTRKGGYHNPRYFVHAERKILARKEHT